MSMSHSGVLPSNRVTGRWVQLDAVALAEAHAKARAPAPAPALALARRNQRGGGAQRGGRAQRAGHRQRGGKANLTRDSPAFNQEQMKVLRDTISAGLSDLYESHRGPPQPQGTSSAHPPQHPSLREYANTDTHFQERAGPSGASH